MAENRAFAEARNSHRKPASRVEAGRVFDLIKVSRHTIIFDQIVTCAFELCSPFRTGRIDHVEIKAAGYQRLGNASNSRSLSPESYLCFAPERL